MELDIGYGAIEHPIRSRHLSLVKIYEIKLKQIAFIWFHESLYIAIKIYLHKQVGWVDIS